VSWNAGAVRLYGYTAAEAVGRKITILCPPERYDEAFHQLDRVREGIPIEHFETSLIRKDGERIEVSLSISPIKDAQGTVIGAAAIARDVTEKMRLQREVLCRCGGAASHRPRLARRHRSGVDWPGNDG